MQKLLIEQTVKTPLIIADPETGIIDIKGRSIPENAKDLFQPLVDIWVDEYFKNPQNQTIINIVLEYYNTSSSMWLLRLFKKIENLRKPNQVIIINWHYADEDMLDSGEDYQAIISLDFNMVCIEEQ